MSRLRLSIVSVLLVAFSAESRAITFADGLSHIIDAANSFPLESVIVQNATTVEMVSGGAVGTLLGTSSTLTVFDTSVVNISGGAVGGKLIMRSNSTATVSGGTFGTGLRTFERSTANISGGTVKMETRAFEDSSIEISGGAHTILLTEDQSIMNLIGGIVTQELRSFDASVMNVSGGSVSGDARASGGSVINISGGTFDGNLLAFDNASLIIKGFGFNFPIGDLVATQGTLTGFLNDGTPVDNFFARVSTATITLVPEPSTALLLASGLLAMAVGRRRRAL